MGYSYALTSILFQLYGTEGLAARSIGRVHSFIATGSRYYRTGNVETRLRHHIRKINKSVVSRIYEFQAVANR